MKRVLHLINSSGFAGGAEHHILSVLQKSNKERVESFLCCITRVTPSNLSLFKKAQGFDSEHTFLSYKLFNFAHISEILLLVKKYHIDILHCHGYKANFLGLISAKLCKTPAITTIHGWTQTNLKLKLYKLLDILIIRLFSKIIVVSKTLKSEIIKTGVSERKIQVISNGINLSKFDSANNPKTLKDNLAIPLHYKVIGIVGRLDREKGHIYFLRAAKFILSEYSDVYFLIIGDGPLRHDLEALVNKMNIKNNVIFTGYQENPMDFLSLLDIFVISSKNEGLPLALLEAMAMKKAVVAFGVGAIPDILKNDLSGIIVKPGDWHELATNILNLIKNDKKRSIFGEVCRKIVEEEYTDSRMVTSLEKIYENL